LWRQHKIKWYRRIYGRTRMTKLSNPLNHKQKHGTGRGGEEEI
jgi:hypothetical protein